MVYRCYITEYYIEGFLSDVPFLDYERHIFNFLLVLAYPDKTAQEIIAKSSEIVDKIGKDPGRLLIFLRFMCECEIMNFITGTEFNFDDVLEIVNDFENWRSEQEEKYNDGNEGEYFHINEYKYYAEFIENKIRQIHHDDSTNRLRLTMPNNSEISYDGNNDFSQEHFGIVKTDIICLAINWGVLVRNLYPNQEGKPDASIIGEHRMPFLNITKDGHYFDDCLEYFQNIYDYCVFSIQCGENEYVTIDCSYYYLFNFLYAEDDLLALNERISKYSKNQVLMTRLSEFNAVYLEAETNWRPVDLITLFPGIDDDMHVLKEILQITEDAHIIKKHGTTDLSPEVVENDAALLEQYLMPLRAEATEYRMNNLQNKVKKLISNVDEQGNIVYGESEGPFIEEMKNYDNIKGMVKLETLFDYDYNLINEFLQTSEPGMIQNVNMYFFDLLIQATDFMKINFLWDMEDASTDYTAVGRFLFDFKELFKQYYSSLNGLQLKYYTNRDWYGTTL